MPKPTRVHGTNGEDTIYSEPGKSVLNGGRGDDVYHVDSPDIYISERNNGGIDTVIATVDWSLDPNVENLILDGEEAKYATGNELDNQLTGNSFANVLDGGLGDDTLIGGAGGNTLIGGDGTDTAVYQGEATDYTFTWNEDALTIVHTDGQIDTLTGVEFLAFDTETIDARSVGMQPLPPEPVAVADTEAGIEDGFIILDVLRNDLGSGLTLVEVTQGAMGETAINADGTITYTPAAQSFGTDTFSYTIADELGRTSSTTVSIDVLAENDAPVAADDPFETPEGEALATAASLLANDNDPDGDVLNVVSYDAQSALGGSVSVNDDGTFSYTPPDGVVGSDSFNYTVGDGSGLEHTATVSVEILPHTNETPQAVNDAYEATADTPFVEVTGVLANDSDPDGDALSVLSYDEVTAAGGTIEMNADGSFNYTPPSGFIGNDTFSYVIGDGQGATDTANATISVSSIDGEGGDTAPLPDYILELISQNDSARLNYPGDVGTSVTVGFAFMDAAPSYYSNPDAIDETFQAFSAQQQDVTRAFLDSISSFTNLTFVEVDSAEEATIAFGMSDLGVDNVGSAWLPSGDSVGTHHSDVWIDVDVGGNTFVEGSDGYWALLHELGHAIGLEHPSLTAYEENHQYTVMSGAPHQSYSLIEGDLEGYQLYDIAALQHLYGSNVSDTSDTIFDFADLDEKLTTIWDAGGQDVIDMRAADYGLRIDLNEGAFSTISELGFDNVAIAYGATIENAFGGDFDDVIQGNQADNWIDGGGGNDSLAGGDGADTFGFGSGWGQDTVEDFVVGEDRLDFSNTGLTLEDLFITTADGNTYLSDGDNTLKLAGVDGVEEELDEAFLLF